MSFDTVDISKIYSARFKKLSLSGCNWKPNIPTVFPRVPIKPLLLNPRLSLGAKYTLGQIAPPFPTTTQKKEKEEQIPRTICSSDDCLSDNVRIQCASESTRVEGDEAMESTVCDGTTCSSDECVSDIVRTQSAPGSSRVEGDEAMGSETVYEDAQEITSKALKLIREAQQYDMQNNSPRALEDYTKALEYLKLALKMIDREPKKPNTGLFGMVKIRQPSMQDIGPCKMSTISHFYNHIL